MTLQRTFVLDNQNYDWISHLRNWLPLHPKKSILYLCCDEIAFFIWEWDTYTDPEGGGARAGRGGWAEVREVGGKGGMKLEGVGEKGRGGWGRVGGKGLESKATFIADGSNLKWKKLGKYLNCCVPHAPYTNCWNHTFPQSPPPFPPFQPSHRSGIDFLRNEILHSSSTAPLFLPVLHSAIKRNFPPEWNLPLLYS